MVGVSISKFFLRSRPRQQEISLLEFFLHSTSTLAAAAAAAPTSNIFSSFIYKVFIYIFY